MACGARRVASLRRGSSALLVALWSSGCLAPGDGSETPADPEIGTPSILDLTLDCKLEAGQWSLEVVTDAWSGGGGILWTEDGSYVELHTNLRSIRAGPGGLRDTLRADLSIVDDFRPAGTGGLTAFTCNAAPSSFVFVLDLEGKPADCRHLGPAPELLIELEDAPHCPLAWEEAAEDG
jgi:hypothetical protein